MAFVRPQCHSHGHSGGIGAATPDGGDIAGCVDALKTRDDGHRPFRDDGGETLAVDAFDARLAMHGSGAHGHLKAEQRARGNAYIPQRHGQQRYRHLLTSRQQAVEFAGVRLRADFTGEVDQAVRMVAHGGHHHRHIHPTSPEARDTRGDLADEFRRADRRTSVFLDDERPA